MRTKFPRVVRSPLLWSILGALCVAVVIVFALRGALERRYLEGYIARVTGASVSIGDVHDGLRSLSLDHVRLEAGGAVLEVARLDLPLRGPLDIVMRSPRASFALAPPTAAADPADTTIRWLTDNRARVRVLDGALDIVPASTSAAAPLHVEALNGTLALDAAGNTYDLAAALADGGRAFPFTAQAVRRDGFVHYAWSAAALPVAPLAALYPSAALSLTGGELHDVAITDDGALSADANVVDVAASAGVHRLRGVRGPLAVRGDRLASTGLSAALDGVPISLVGEVHDFAHPARDLRDGTPELHELYRLFTMVADQPTLQFIKLETTAPGVAFAQYGQRSAVGPRVISLVVVDPAEPSLRLGTAISSDHVISKGERTSQMARRTGAVAGVNGDYFDIGRSYEPQGLLVHDGVIVRGPTDRAALVIDRSNKVTFAEFRLSGKVQLGGRSLPVTQINTWPPGEATLITPDYGPSLPPAPATFVRIKPVDAARHLFAVTAVEAADGGLPASLGIGLGPLAAGAHARVGDRFRLEYSLVPKVDGVVAGIGGGPILLKDGAWYEDHHAPAPAERDVRWPVVALGSTAEGLLLLAAVDGRHPERAVGMTRPEFADLLRGYGVRDAMALDSGGSVTLVSRAPGDRAASVRNTPSDDSAERYISDALLVFSSAPPDAIIKPSAPSPR